MPNKKEKEKRPTLAERGIFDAHDGLYDRVKWPLAGYAPGGYMITCRSCDRKIWNCDKRAYQCLPCAITSIQDSYQSLSHQLKTVTFDLQAIKSAVAVIGSLFNGNQIREAVASPPPPRDVPIASPHVDVGGDSTP